MAVFEKSLKNIHEFNGDEFELLMLSSGEEEWDPWLESECRIGSGGIFDAGFILCKMHILLSSGWGTGNRGGTCNIGNNDAGGRAEFRNGTFEPGVKNELKLVYGCA